MDRIRQEAEQNQEIRARARPVAPHSREPVLSVQAAAALSLFLSLRAAQPQRPVSLKFSKAQWRWQQRCVQECASAYHRGSGSSSQSQCAAAYHWGSSSSSQSTRGRAMRALLRVPRQLLLLLSKRRLTSGGGLSRARNSKVRATTGPRSAQKSVRATTGPRSARSSARSSVRSALTSAIEASKQ